MSANSAFSVMTAVKAAFGFIPAGISRAWLSLGLLLVVFGINQANVLPAPSGNIMLMAAIVLQFSAIGALYRVAIFDQYARAEGLGPGGLQFSKPEWRLVGATLLVSLFWLMVFITLSLVLAVILSASGLGSETYNNLDNLFQELTRGAVAGYVVIGFIILTLVVLGVLSLKLCLYQPATIAGRQMISLNALSLSTGQVVKLLAGYAILTVPVVGLAYSLQGFENHWVGRLVNVVVAVLFILPVTVGFLSSAYKQIMDLRTSH